MGTRLQVVSIRVVHQTSVCPTGGDSSLVLGGMTLFVGGELISPPIKKQRKTLSIVKILIPPPPPSIGVFEMHLVTYNFVFMSAF